MYLHWNLSFTYYKGYIYIVSATARQTREKLGHLGGVIKKFVDWWDQYMTLYLLSYDYKFFVGSIKHKYFISGENLSQLHW